MVLMLSQPVHVALGFTFGHSQHVYPIPLSRPYLLGEVRIGLIDIQIGYAFDEVLYIAIECKRISSAGNTLARKYVREGIHRFVTGKYSGGHALGGMVGYVICGNPAACTTRVQQQLVKESVEITGYDAESGWIESRSWVPYETLYESRHRQMGDSHVIVLVHSFLTVF